MAELAILNNMAGSDFEAALDRHVEWGLRVLDLKSGIFGKGVVDLTDEEAKQARTLIEQRGLAVHTLSTNIGDTDIEPGEAVYREKFAGQIDRAIAVGRILQASHIRLLAPRTSRRSELADAAGHIRAVHPWLIDFFREAIDALAEAGFDVLIENEAHGCVMSNADEILGFLDLIDRDDRCALTWDVQNLWQMGTFPSIELYERLRPRIGLVHLKGGQSETPGGPLVWRSALEEASWPVAPIVRKVLEDGVSPVIVLNPSHGQAKPGYNYDDITGRDIRFMRETFAEVK